MPTAGVVAGSPDVVRDTMPITPDCKRMPESSGVAAANAGTKMISIPPDRANISGAGVATGAPGPGRETMPIPSDCERVPGTGGNSGDLFFMRLYVKDDFFVEVRFFQDGRTL